MFRTLVVDDQAGFRTSVRDLLQRQFGNIRGDEAGDGPEALSAIERCAPDLVLLDIRLPSASGIELTKVIKTVQPSVAVVILTGHELPQYRQAAVRNGADCFIYKGSTSCMKEIAAQVEGALLARQGGR